MLGQWIQWFKSRGAGVVHMNAQISPITVVATEGTVMHPEFILRPDQLAKRLQCNVSWIYEATRMRGRFAGDPLPTLRRGRFLLFYWPDVCEWLRRGGGR
jgi:hypothetical protein